MNEMIAFIGIFLSGLLAGHMLDASLAASLLIGPAVFVLYLAVR
jgi:hypothetical protein